MVNLLAHARSTATFGGVAANRVTLVVQPCKALKSSETGAELGTFALGWPKGHVQHDTAFLHIGALAYDQRRHIVMHMADGFPNDVKVALKINDRVCATATLPETGANTPLFRK